MKDFDSEGETCSIGGEKIEKEIVKQNNAIGEMWNSRDRPKGIIQNAFNDFHQHDYDFE